MANIGSIIAKAQITNGGPVILFQPENEYSSGSGIKFPDGKYMQYVIDQAHNAGIVVPLISNDAYAGGHNAPGTGLGEVDIYVSTVLRITQSCFTNTLQGHDSYPLGFDCVGFSCIEWKHYRLTTSPTGSSVYLASQQASHKFPRNSLEAEPQHPLLIDRGTVLNFVWNVAYCLIRC